MPTDLLKSLQADGFEVTLSLKVTGDKVLTEEQRALIREKRDDLLTLLAARQLSSTGYHFNISTSSGKAYTAAKPHHLKEAVELYPWGVVFDSEKRLITSWGNVPRYALMDKRNLETGDLLSYQQASS